MCGMFSLFFLLLYFFFPKFSFYQYICEACGGMCCNTATLLILHLNTLKDISQDLFGFFAYIKTTHSCYKANNTLYRKSVIISQKGGKKSEKKKSNARHSNVVSLVSIRKICQKTNRLPWGNVPRCKFRFNFKITSVITSPVHRSTHMHTKTPSHTEGDRL